MSTSSATQTVSPLALERLRDAMQSYVTTTNIPGIVMLLYQRGQVLFRESVGLSNLETQRPMQPDTLFRIASMTKPIASTAALMLMEAGKLRLDDPVSRYIPEFGHTKVVAGVKDGKLQLEDQQRPMTLFDVLTHTAGVPYAPAEPLLAQLHMEADIANPNHSLAEMIRALASVPLAFQSGSQWDYGLAYDILSRIVEVVGEIPFDQFLEEKILAPLGMTDTAYFVPDSKAERAANCYDISEAQPKNRQLDISKPKACGGDGGLFSTAGDYLRFARLLLNKGELDGVCLLTPQTIEQMTSNQLNSSLYLIHILGAASEGQSYGLGVGVIVDPVSAALAGSTGTYGWGGSTSTYFWVDPVQEMIGIVMAQFTPFFHIHIDQALGKIVYEGLES